MLKGPYSGGAQQLPARDVHSIKHQKCGIGNVKLYVLHFFNFPAYLLREQGRGSTLVACNAIESFYRPILLGK